MPNILLDAVIIGGFVIAIYAFIFLPRQMNFRRTQKYVKETLTPGDEVVTYGGVIGTVRRIDAEKALVFVEIAPGVEIRVLSASIASPYHETFYAQEAKKGQK
jgi:preprotein translocase subunit YajC